MERKLEELKIAVVHDHLEWKGGGERLSLLLALGLKADYITAYASAATFPDYQQELGSRFKTLTDKALHTRGLRFFWIRWLFWKNRRLLKQYDVLIASGQPAMEAVAAHAKKGAVKILYNHTPPRRVFDLYQESRAFYPPLLRPFFGLFVRLWRHRYLRALDRMDFDVCNSETVRERLVKYTGRDANAIVWPPILTDKFKHLADGDYFLSWSRLDEAKRVEVVVAAFAKMPDKQLVVASSGNRLAACKTIAANCPNITFVDSLPDDQLFDLVGRCRAVIYIPKDEDAGMIQLEANAAGKPVLGVAEGGIDESIINNVTGLKAKANPTAADVMAAAEAMTPEWCSAKREACIEHAKNFSYEVFIKRLQEIILLNHPDRKIIGVDASRWEDPRFPGAAHRSGVEIYSWHLLESLAKFFADQPYRLRFYAPRAIPTLPLTIQKVLPPTRAWTLRALTHELKRNPPDVFFTPAYFIPAHAPKRSLAVIHDLAFETAPHRYSAVDWLRQVSAWAANRKRAAQLIAVSRATAKDIADRHPRVAKKTVFVPPGYEPMGTSPVQSEKSPAPAIAYVGRLDKKKSVALLINAFSNLAKRFPDWQLDLVGGDGFGATDIRAAAAASPASKRIIFHGYATEAEKALVLGQATIFVQPGSAEGSALSLLEAWDAGAAAVVADIPVMREIGQDGALFFKPEDPDDLEEKIVKLIEDQKLRDQLVAIGQKNLKNYSWDKTAEAIGRIILE